MAYWNGPRERERGRFTPWNVKARDGKAIDRDNVQVTTHALF